MSIKATEHHTQENHINTETMSVPVIENGSVTGTVRKDGGFDKESCSEDNTNEDGNTVVIHNNMYPTACSNTVTLTSITVKKANNITSLEMRSSGTVPKNGNILNYLSTATLKI